MVGLCLSGRGGPALAAPATAAATAPGAATAAEGHVVTRSGTAMGTALQIRVWSDGHREDAEVEGAIEAALAEISRLERLMTTWRADSDISRVNAAAGQGAVAVSPEVYDVVRRALLYSRLSGGAFDISFDALHGLWRFDDDLTPAVPDAAELRARRRLIDWRRILIEDRGRTVRLATAGMRINLGGIGKGYAVDAAAAVLRQRGFGDNIVQAGGDLMLSGSKGGQPWMTGIRDPRGAAGDYFAVCPVVDHAFSTAGDYERSFILSGKRYHHIIDPRTGYPAQGARSVTIYARDATTADGLDDAVLILGPDKGLKLIEQLPDVGAVIVTRDNQVVISPRLRGRVQIVRPPTPGI